MRRGNILKKVISIIVSIVLVLMISPFAVYSADYPNDGEILGLLGMLQLTKVSDL